MSFADPLWLVAGAIATVLLALLFRRADRRRAADLARLVSPHLVADLTASVSAARRRTKRAIAAGALGLGAVALSGPQLGFHWEESHRRGLDVMIALDVSRSMLARDVLPSRLERAKLAIADLVAQLGGDRVGLVAFAGTAFVQCPLTLDHAAFAESLAVLEPGIIPAPGSDLAAAIDVSIEAFRTEKRNVKLLVLLSDGEDLGGGAVAAARRAAEAGLRVFTIGLGSPEGELIPVPREGGGTAFLKDPSGHLVKSRLDEATLREVATITDGRYVPLGPGGEGVTTIVDEALASIPREELASRMRRVPYDRYQWPLGLALALLALEPWIGERARPVLEALRTRLRVRRTATENGPTGAGAKAGEPPSGGPGSGARPASSRRVPPAAAVLVLTLLAGALPAVASPSSARRLYDAGDFDRALEEYRAAAREDREDARIDFNLGAAAYRAGRYDEAAAAFARALRAQGDELQQRGFYNLGNAQFRAGEQIRQADPKQTMQAWKQALDAYDQALRLGKEDADAKHNRELVAKAIEALEQEQRQREQQQESSGDPKQDESGEDDERGEPKPDEKDQSGERGEPKPGDPGDDASRSDHGEAPRPTPPGETGSNPQEAGPPPGSAPEPTAREGDPTGGPKPTPAPPDAPETSAGGESSQPSPSDPAKPGEADAGPNGTADAGSTEGGAAGQAAQAGQMTAADARELLESLRSEERRVPLIPAAPGSAGRRGGAERDW